MVNGLGGPLRSCGSRWSAHESGRHSSGQSRRMRMAPRDLSGSASESAKLSSPLARQAATCFFHSCILHPLHAAPLRQSCSLRGSCSGYAVLHGEKAPDAPAREVGAMGLL